MIRKFALIAVAAVTGVANAGDIQYSLAIEGVDPADYETLAPGEYTLQVWGEVTDNDLGGGFAGGILQYAVQLNADDDAALEFVEGTSGPVFNPTPSGTWDSSTVAPSDFVNAFQGVLRGNGNDVFAETGGASPGNYDNIFGEYGAGAASLLTSGPIVYSGGEVTIEVSGNVADQVIYGPSFAGEAPGMVAGSSITLGGFVIPEPSTAILAAVALAGFAARRK